MLLLIQIDATPYDWEEQLEGKVCNDTQFQRAMKELGITTIIARSPQAKGRIERLFKPVTFEESDREILEMLQEIFLGKYKKLA